MTEQETHYQKELALVLSRLRGIEYMVNTIAAAGEGNQFHMKYFKMWCTFLSHWIVQAMRQKDSKEYVQHATASIQLYKQQVLVQILTNVTHSSVK